LWPPQDSLYDEKKILCTVSGSVEEKHFFFVEKSMFILKKLFF